MRIVTAKGDTGEAIAGVPAVDARGQGGLLDVALSPGFPTDNTVYWSYSEPRQGGNATSVARGVLSADRARLAVMSPPNFQDAVLNWRPALPRPDKLEVEADENSFAAHLDRREPLRRPREWGARRLVGPRRSEAGRSLFSTRTSRSRVTSRSSSIGDGRSVPGSGISHTNSRLPTVVATSAAKRFVLLPA